MDHHKQSPASGHSASILLPDANTPSGPAAHLAPSGKPLAFTKANIVKLRCPPGKSEAFFWDPNCSGFGLRALSTGRRSWVFQYRDEHRRTRRIALGDVTAVSLEAARDAARRHAASITQGGNPSVARRATRKAARVIDVVDAYLAYAKDRLRPRSFEETERHLRSHARALHHDRAEAVTRRDIGSLLERLAKSSGPVSANRTRAALSAMWSWALRTGMIEADSNPVAFTVRQVETPRERTLSDAELRAILEATTSDRDYDRIVRLCLLTGCRREEIGRLRWDEIGNDWLIIAAGRMKGGITHEVPMLPPIADALPPRPQRAEGCVFGRHGTGFSGWSRSKKGLDARVARLLAEAGIKMAPWTLHDLRRTFSTKLHDAGTQPIVVEALLAHKQQGVAGVYNRASFRDAKREALSRWHELLASITADGVKPVRMASAVTSTST